MTTIYAELRPAWRNYWTGFLVAGFLLLVALGVSAVGAGEEGFFRVFSGYPDITRGHRDETVSPS